MVFDYVVWGRQLAPKGEKKREAGKKCINESP
jgi:hypothetical protein